MISPLDTQIAYFGSTENIAVTEALAKLRGAGYDIVAGSHDPRDAPLLRALGIPFISDRIEAVSGCQVVLTSLPAPQMLEDLYFGDQGLVELVDQGTYLVDLSFTTPQLAREIHALAAASDVYALDAPIVNLGDEEQAIAYVGGDEEAREALTPLLPYLAPTVMPQEGAGGGQFAAMVAYISLAGALMSMIEALALARVAGVSDKAALNVIAMSSGASRALVGYAPRVLASNYSGRLKTIEFLDALDTALTAADQLGLTLPMTETACQLYDLLSVVGGDDLNLQAIALLYADEKTCASFGLDWTRADAVQEMYEAGVDDMAIEEFLQQHFGEAAGDDGTDEGDDGPFGGYPLLGGFFSRN